MELKHAEFIVNILENAGEEATIRKDYSGRGMYGDTTTAIETDLHPVQWIPIIFAWVNENIHEEPSADVWGGGQIPDFDSFRIDNMGLGWVIY